MHERNDVFYVPDADSAGEFTMGNADALEGVHGDAEKRRRLFQTQKASGWQRAFIGPRNLILRVTMQL